MLSPFEIDIPDEKIDALAVYVDVLLRWNRKINLTSISTPEECITRHFGESLMLSRMLPLRGSLLDIGSGAGFPGLALKLLATQLNVVLLEPVAKKRAFLKEVARVCNLGWIQVVDSRLAGFANSHEGAGFDIITARAVGDLPSLIGPSGRLLGPNGRLCLWVGRKQTQAIQEASSSLEWLEASAVPFTRDRVIFVGVRREGNLP